MRRILLKQTGDTIVEVLIAIAVVSAVIGGAYQVSSRSLKDTRQAQEHSEALKYAESQLEQIQSDSTVSAPNIFTTGMPFYMSNGAPTVGTTTAGSGVVYTISDTRAPGPSPNEYIFTANVSWASVQGSGNDHVSLVYKVDN